RGDSVRVASRSLRRRVASQLGVVRPMPTPLPFGMTPEASDYVRSCLRPPSPGEELALITVLRQAKIIDGQERVWFDSEHFMICTYNLGRRPYARHIELFGHQVSIVPSTLESLRDRTLTIRRVVDCSGELRDVLVAA